MKIGRSAAGVRGRAASSAPIRVSMDSKHGSMDAIRFRLLATVAKQMRWKKGDKIEPDFDPESGTITLDRNADGWSLADAANNGSALTLRLSVNEEARKAFGCFALPADITDYIDDEGRLVFALPRK